MPDSGFAWNTERIKLTSGCCNTVGMDAGEVQRKKIPLYFSGILLYEKVRYHGFLNIQTTAMNVPGARAGPVCLL